MREVRGPNALRTVIVDLAALTIVKAPRKDLPLMQCQSDAKADAAGMHNAPLAHHASMKASQHGTA